MRADEPDRPDDHVEHAPAHAHVADKDPIDLCVLGHEEPSNDESGRFNERKEPLAMLDERPHERIELDDLALRVEPSCREEVQKADRHQQQDPAGWGDRFHI